MPLKSFTNLAPLLRQIDERTVRILIQLISSLTPQQLQMTMQLLEDISDKLDPVTRLTSMLGISISTGSRPVTTSGTIGTRGTHVVTSGTRTGDSKQGIEVVTSGGGESKGLSTAMTHPVDFQVTSKVENSRPEPVRITLTTGDAPIATTASLTKQYTYCHRALSKPEGAGRKLRLVR